MFSGHIAAFFSHIHVTCWQVVVTFAVKLLVLGFVSSLPVVVAIALFQASTYLFILNWNPNRYFWHKLVESLVAFVPWLQEWARLAIEPTQLSCL